MSIAKFQMTSESYGLEVKVDCSMDEAGSYPNQGELREALSRLISALENWDHVTLTIDTVAET